MACCNYIFMLQELILWLHNMSNFSNDVPSIFLIQEIGGFLCFYINVNFTIT